VTTKLYVGNLPYSTTDTDLRDLFSQAGEIADATVIIDRETGRSRGFGFVNMATEEGAQEAIRRFNGYQMSNRALTVNEARPREDRPSPGGGGGFRRDNDRGPRGPRR
jgi:RNA recognition motif-containing protein